MTPDDRVLVAAPLYHKNALVWTKVGMAAGASLVLLARFDQRLYVESIGRYEVTRLSGVPTMFHLILSDPALAATDKSSVRFIGVGSAPASPALFEALHRAFPNAAATNGYGVTEAGPVMFANHPNGLPRPATSIGYPLEGCEIRLDPGPDEGVLLTRNPGVMAAYHNLPEETARRLKDGWFDTSDVCRRDADGFYYFVGRTDDMFVCGGENVYPGDVEGTLERHPDVLQAAVLPVDHELKGQVPVAFVVARPGSGLSEQAVKEWALAHGPAYQHPAARVPRPRAAPGRDEQDRSRGAQGARAGARTHEESDHVHRSPDIRERRRRRGRGRGGPAGAGAHRARHRTRTRCCSSRRSRTRRPSRSTTRSTRTSRRRPGIEVVMEYPGFANIAKRVATLIAAGTPPEIVWYGAGQAMNLALENQLADVGDVLKATGGTAENLRLVYKGADRSIPTSQQFTYGWYRKDLFQAKNLSAPKSWDDYLKAAKALNNPPNMYGCIVPSAETGASTLLLETMFMKNDVHWFEWNAGKKDYEVVLDKGDQKKRAVETLDYLNELHKFSPEASTYNWGELMSTYFTEKAATSWYVGSRLLDQTIANNPKIADATVPFELPKKLTDHYYLSDPGLPHPGEVQRGRGQEVRDLLHEAPRPDQLVPRGAAAHHPGQPADAELGQVPGQPGDPEADGRAEVPRLGVDQGRAALLLGRAELNPYIGLFHNENLAGWMLAARNIKGMKSEQVVDEAAGQVRKKMRRVG